MAAVVEDAADRETSVTAPVLHWKRNASLLKLVSVAPATRFVAPLANRTHSPSALTAGANDAPFAVAVGEAEARETRLTVPLARWNRNTSVEKLASDTPATRSVASLANRTQLPSALIVPANVGLLAVMVAEDADRETRVTLPVLRW